MPPADHAAVRGDVSLPGLLREAMYRALDDAALTMADIDAVVIPGKGHVPLPDEVLAYFASLRKARSR